MENEVKNVVAAEEVAEKKEEEVVVEKKARKPRAKKVVEEAVEEKVEEVAEVKVRKPRAKKVVAPVEEAAAPVEEAKEEVAEVKVRKPRAKKVAAPVEEEVTAPVEEVKEEVAAPVEEVKEEAATPVEEVKEEVAAQLKELQLVNGVIVEVLPFEEEKVDRKGTVVRKAKEERVLVQLDNGQEGLLFRKDVAGLAESEDLFSKFIEGEEIKAVVKKIFPDGGKVLLSTELLKTREDLGKFEEVIKNHGVFTAKVTKNIKVGLLLKYNDYSCLLPTSQVDVEEDKLSELVGQELLVAPIRVDYNRIRLIVSNTVALAIKNREAKNDFMSKLEIGQVYEGVVKNIENYGAFVEIAKGIEGLLHISELDHNRVFKVEKVLNVGDAVKVQVIKVEKGHIGLSRKALIPNYWADFVNNKEVGSLCTGKVAEINKAGVVLELSNEVTGFLPKSEVSWERDAEIESVVAVGSDVEVKIIEIDPTKKRIILSLKQLSQNPWDNITFKVNDMIEVKVAKILKDGAKISYNGLSGYVSKNSLGDYKFEELQEGQEITVKVRVVDSEKTKFIVAGKSQYQEERHYEKDSFAKYMKNQEKVSNTFGDLIGDKLKNYNNKKR